MTGVRGSRLLLPLRRLEAEQPAPVPRRLDLDAHGSGPIGVWHAAVTASAEACLLLDCESRVVAASASVGAVLGTTAATALGARIADLVTAVDFTAGAVPDEELERSMPPLRALRTGGLARGLLRLRSAAGLVTYDVIAVPLVDQAGVLAFFLPV